MPSNVSFERGPPPQGFDSVNVAINGAVSRQQAAMGLLPYVDPDAKRGVQEAAYVATMHVFFPEPSVCSGL